MTGRARWSDEQLRLAVELAWRAGRAWAPRSAREWLAWLEQAPRVPRPSTSWETRVSERAQRTDGRPDYPGGPVDWDTGQPLAP
jgi:hypothetical protein